MTDTRLSRRERQIMDILFAREEATVLEIQERLPDPPTPMAIRRMLQILEEKSQVRRRKEGRGFVYMPKQTRRRAGAKALSHWLPVPRAAGPHSGRCRAWHPPLGSDRRLHPKHSAAPAYYVAS